MASSSAASIVTTVVFDESTHERRKQEAETEVFELAIMKSVILHHAKQGCPSLLFRTPCVAWHALS